MGYVSQTSGIVDHAFLKNLYNGVAGYGVESGMALSVTGASMVVTIASGVVQTATARTVYAGGTLTPANGDATNPRIDLIIWDNSANAPAVLAGVATAESASQTRPPATDLADANDLVLGAIYILAGGTTILAANVFDRSLTPPLGLTLVAANVTEATMTSATAADMVTITGLTIPATTGIVMVVVVRKDSAANAGAFGLKVNATVVMEAVNGGASLARFDATAEAQSGVIVIFIGPRRTNYARVVTGAYTLGGATTVVANIAPPVVLTAAVPVAEVTDLIIRGDSDGANAIGVQGVYVYTLGG